jgi:hypothetical protein
LKNVAIQVILYALLVDFGERSNSGNTICAAG